MKKFVIHPANTFFWNRTEFIDFLIENQGQEIEISTMQEGCCLKTNGVYTLLEQFKFTDVTILTNNLLEYHDTYKIKYVNPFYFFKLLKDNYETYHTWNNRKVFGCFYNRPLWHRIGLAATLQNDYSHMSLINVRCSMKDINKLQLFEVQQLFENHFESFKKFATVSESWPIQLESVDTYGFCNTNQHTDQLAEFYNDFLIDIVAETWSHGNCFFPTEKTIRPMLLKKPMIVMGPKNYLLYLRQMGFRTFADFWDEDYDGYEGVDRYTRILALIDTLAKKNLKEFESMFWDMKYSLDHNYNCLMSQKFQTNLTEIR